MQNHGGAGQEYIANGDVTTPLNRHDSPKVELQAPEEQNKSPIWDRVNPHPQAVGINFRIDQILSVDTADQSVIVKVTEIVRWHEADEEKLQALLAKCKQMSSKKWYDENTQPVPWSLFEEYDGYKPKLIYQNADFDYGERGFQATQLSCSLYLSGPNKGCLETWKEGLLKLRDPIDKMENFPFDFQDWEVKLRMEEDLAEWDRFFQHIVSSEHEDSMHCSVDTQAIPEWDICSNNGEGPWKKWNGEKCVDLAVHTDPSSVGYWAEWNAKFVMQRRSSYYVMNIWILTIVFTAMAITTFSLEADAVNDRLNIILALLFVLAAFKWSFADSIPKLSYFTSLDLAVYIGFLELCLLLCAQAVVATYATEDNVEDWDKFLMWAYIASLVFTNLCLFTRVKVLYHKEKRQLEKELTEQNQNPSLVKFDLDPVFEETPEGPRFLPSDNGAVPNATPSATGDHRL